MKKPHHRTTVGEVNEERLEEGLPIGVVGRLPVNLKLLQHSLLPLPLLHCPERLRRLLSILLADGMALQFREMASFRVLSAEPSHLVVALPDPALRHPSQAIPQLPPVLLSVK